ncbi:MAG: response regulator [Ktedonobacteraceae bacterium]|nr:response regulator [Ktedonobacteraceae bacterium]
MFSILVVESGRLITRLLQESLGIEQCHIDVIYNGEDAVLFALHTMPSLIILDVTLPGVDGYAIIQRLREHPKSMHIPIIMLSSSPTLTEKIRALELGIDCYIGKPVNRDELLANVRRQLSRVQQTSLSPLTRLPGGVQLKRAIEYKLKSEDPWSLLYLDLDHFKAFNDIYGFLAGNDMILLVGDICQRVVYRYGNTDDFVGHIGGDDFVIVTTPDREKTLCQHILETYRRESAVLYREEDLKRGTICGVDRKGRSYESPLVTLSIGVVSDRQRCPHSIDEVGTLAAQAKLRAKQSSDNIFCISSQSYWRPLALSTKKSSGATIFTTTIPLSLTAFGRQDLSPLKEDAMLEI